MSPKPDPISLLALQRGKLQQEILHRLDAVTKRWGEGNTQPEIAELYFLVLLMANGVCSRATDEILPRARETAKRRLTDVQLADLQQLLELAREADERELEIRELQAEAPGFNDPESIGQIIDRRDDPM